MTETGTDPLLAQRDLHFVEGLLPGIAGFVHRYFRTSVKGMERIPRDDAVLFVGNHSGGTVSPDSVAFILHYLDRFGIAQREAHLRQRFEVRPDAIGVQTRCTWWREPVDQRAGLPLVEHARCRAARPADDPVAE